MSLNFMFWNVRGVVNSPTRNVIKRYINLYNGAFLVIIEPLTQPDPELYSRIFGLEYRGTNANGKIWVFTEHGSEFEVLEDSDQIIHGRFVSPKLALPLCISAVYGKCSRAERYLLWDKLRALANSLNGVPWMIGGDFNTILHLRDRVGSETNR